MISPKLSGLRNIINNRALQTSLYSNLQEEILDNGFIVNELILNTDINHLEKTFVNLSILTIFVYGFFYFKQTSYKDKKLEKIETYRIIKKNMKGLIVILGVLLFKNVDDVL